MSATTLHLKAVAIRAANGSLDVTVSFLVDSDLGPVVIEVPVDGVHSLDNAVDVARVKVGRYAEGLVQASARKFF